MEKNKVVLVTLSPKTHRTSEENLGIEYLKSSLVKNGYSVEIIDGWLNELSIDEVYDKIVNISNPLFVGISSYMSNTLPSIDLMKRLKKHDEDTKIVCGGFGPTFFAEDYLNNGADIVIRGEGERVICNLADSLRFNMPIDYIRGISYKTEDGTIFHNEIDCLIKDLDSLPFPSRDTIETVLNKKSTVNILTSRGCSGNCDFCSVISFFRLSDGKVWRTRSIENIVNEIEELYKQGIVHIKAVDDSFVDGIRDETWCKEFADEIEKRGIKVRLRGQIRADKITDSTLNDLKRAGFFSFACGIENGSETALRRMNKMSTLEDNKRALELLKKYNYIVQMGYILFDKDTTFEELQENYLFLQEHAFAVTKGIFSEMYSAEGTKLNTRLKQQGDLVEGTFTETNNKYLITDEKVRKIYEALKRWHKSHSDIYDMTIDPVCSPKAIDEESMQAFYSYIMKLKEVDLEIFRFLLDQISHDENSDLLSGIETRIDDTRGYYSNIYDGVKQLYKRNGLIYNADKNPFI